MGFSLHDAGKEISAWYTIQPKMLNKRGRDSETAEARKVFAYLCREELGHRVNIIAEYLGLSRSATSICVAKGEKIVQNRSGLNQLFNLRPLSLGKLPAVISVSLVGTLIAWGLIFLKGV